MMGMVRDKDHETCVHEVASRADDFFTPVCRMRVKAFTDAYTRLQSWRGSRKRVYESAEHYTSLH